MYSRSAWGGNTDPFILTKFAKSSVADENSDPRVSLVIFEWSDEPLIGRRISDDPEVCDSLLSYEESPFTHVCCLPGISIYLR